MCLIFGACAPLLPPGFSFSVHGFLLRSLPAGLVFLALDVLLRSLPRVRVCWRSSFPSAIATAGYMCDFNFYFH
jgi:hypothetical protein